MLNNFKKWTQLFQNYNFVKLKTIENIFCCRAFGLTKLKNFFLRIGFKCINQRLQNIVLLYDLTGFKIISDNEK